jgi:EmrB/QacA subfamily drug resistance transporter
VTQTKTPEAATQSETPVPWTAIRVVLTGSFMAVLDTFIVLVAAPAIQDDLHASSAQLQFVIAAYQLAYAVFLVTGARLGDLYGRKRLFILGMSLFTLSSVACGAAPSPGLLIAARVVQGIAAALMFPQVFSMIQVLVPGPQRHRAFGMLGAVIGISTTIGQLVGGLLIGADLAGTGWRPVFWVNLPIGIVAVLLAARVVPESRSEQARGIDPVGVATLTAALVLLVTPLIEGRQTGWPAWTWWSLGLSVPAFLLFGYAERAAEAAGKSPLLSLRLLRERPFVIGMTLVVLGYAGVNSFFLILSLTLQNGFGLSALGAGLAYTPLAAGFFAASLLAGRLAPRLGRRLLTIGAGIGLVGFLGTWALAGHLGPLMAPLILVGVGNGILLTPLLNAVLARIRPTEIGMASGILSTAQQVGGAVGVAVIGVLFFQAVGAGTGRVPYSHGLAVAVWFNVALAAVIAALTYALPQPTRTS